jgi:hypothetical protein
MGRATPPFRADHVGSLLRPRRLLQARDDHAAGRMSDEQLRAVEDDAIRDVVAMQRDVGLQSATDGKFRRVSWHMDFIHRLGGVSQAPEHLKVQFRNPTGTIEFTSAALKIDGKVRLERTIFGEDFQALQAMVTSGGQAPAQAADRGRQPLRAAGAAVPVAAVRLLLHGRGQPAHLRRAGRQAPPDRRDRQGGVGVARSAFLRPWIGL